MTFSFFFRKPNIDMHIYVVTGRRKLTVAQVEEE